MSIESLKISDFRCIEHVELGLKNRTTLVHGANGAGKTSILEAIYCLSRGRSFRGTRTDQLVRHQQKHYTLFATARNSGIEHKLGLAAGRSYRQIRVDGADAQGLASLAEILAVQVIDPEIQALISEGPELRRQFLDYGVFHVEHEFLPSWRQYRRALKQRNMALRSGRPERELAIWDEPLAQAAELIDSQRVAYTEKLNERFGTIGDRLLPGSQLSCSYRHGWEEGIAFDEALAAARERDREQGTTTVGPHRADLTIDFAGRRARQQVSRGQQKLVASSLVLAQTLDLHERTEQIPVLLVDDPAAELDQEALSRLLAEVDALSCQLVITALDPERIQLAESPSMFHVKHGAISG